jgi:hypothetical protein
MAGPQHGKLDGPQARMTAMTESPPDVSTSRPPLSAALLGAGGALPFIGLTLAALFHIEPFGRQPVEVLAIYGAVILSFMGAIHWGLAMARGLDGKTDVTNGYVVSVLPALLGWFVLSFLPVVLTLRVLAATFALLLAYDLQVQKSGWLPSWYSRLRWPLTGIAVVALLTCSAIA